MRRSIAALALVVLTLIASSARASDATVNYQCCSYTPDTVRLLPDIGQSVTWAGVNGADFTQHPLHFVNPTVGDPTTGSSTDRTFIAAGVYLWYCGVHGHFDGVNVSGMSGRVIVTANSAPVASFTASATDVASGTEVAFNADGSSDADVEAGTQTVDYSWDLDGNGSDDPGETSSTPTATFTNAGPTPWTVTVRLTVTDTNSDAVGPESSTKTKVITVEPSIVPPAPGGGGAPDTTGGGATDTTAPKVHLTLARTLTVGSKLRVAFTIDEAASGVATLKVGAKKARVTHRFDLAGRHTLTIALSKALRRLLRHRRAATLTLVVTDAAGNATTLKRTLRLKSG